MEKLKTGAENMGISLDDTQLDRFEKYMDMLLNRNKVMNLTAITEKDEIISRHFLDSVTPLMTDKFPPGASVIDIGAGAGFPSLPLKIARPDLCVTMLDSLNKRVGFLNDVILSLGLENIEAVHMRAEDGGHSELRESFDVAVARAVADLSVLAEYALPFVKVGGCFIAMKGGDPEEEIGGAKAAIKALGGRIEAVKEVHIDEGGLDHTLCIINKIGRTPSKYPRKAGKPAKEPIK
ncbi:MAG: 16S rRNA (guanine(527)-N(7))-methyltransferase RsmG [Oscillospiraceae bacterium]|nr:16S rRNA (guanine(527)-N(7))-methyltransferase RsmG [Oscillospiraceae bacterium]